jgi:hypothetical protein
VLGLWGCFDRSPLAFRADYGFHERLSGLDRGEKLQPGRLGSRSTVCHVCLGRSDLERDAETHASPAREFGKGLIATEISRRRLRQLVRTADLKRDTGAAALASMCMFGLFHSHDQYGRQFVASLDAVRGMGIPPVHRWSSVPAVNARVANAAGLGSANMQAVPSHGGLSKARWTCKESPSMPVRVSPTAVASQIDCAENSIAAPA